MIVGLVGATGIASADPVTTIDPAMTLGGGIVPCIGQVRGFYDPARNFNGDQVMWIRAEFTTLASGSGGCAVNATVSWRNLDTGASAVNPIVPLGDDGSHTALWVPVWTGKLPGRIEVTIDTDQPHIAGHGSFVIPG
ncbi:hypothetical protein ACFVUS_14280 [Nocardia sp. NPDC058058]|uniref:hypothetical protein n=1 Tax=Nocardia sp. NPDC058058 TaxID=3346317 RepID=UPI0036DEA08C